MTHALGTLGSIDPELLQARVAALKDAGERKLVATIVTGTYASLAKIQSVDFAQLERLTSKIAKEVWDHVAEETAALWRAVDELQNELKPLIAQHQLLLGDDNGDVSLDVVGDAPPAAARTEARAPLTPVQRIGETAWATSFVLAGEIESFKKRLPALLRVPDPWELISDLQDHMGHVKAALSAILTGVYSSLPSTGAQQGDEANLELWAARELRARIFEVRDLVLGVERDMETRPASTWQELLARAHTGVERFMFGPGFAWMRAADKRTFLKQHHVLGELLELWSPLRALPARRAIQNMARYLEALEVINLRECLVTHDRAALEVLVAQARAALQSEGHQRREYVAAALAALAEVQGRDRELDALLEQTLAPGSPVPLNAMAERGSAILAGLGGAKR